MEKNKRYVIVSRIRVVNLSTVNSGAMLAVWGQNSTGTAYTPTGISINNKSESSSYVTVKFVFDYVGETGLTDVGICWCGLMDGSSPCQIRFHWMQLYQDDTADLGFYCSHQSWLDDQYKESNHIPDSESVAEYNQKPALNVENNNLYFFGKVQSAVGNVGFVNYTTNVLSAETSSPFYEDASVVDLNKTYSFESSMNIIKPDGILDGNGLSDFVALQGTHLLSVYEYSSFRSNYIVKTAENEYMSTVSGIGLNAKSLDGFVVYGSNGITIDGTTTLTREELKKLKELAE